MKTSKLYDSKFEQDDEDCCICYQEYTKQRRKCITCFKCGISACKECLQKILIDSPQHPHCFECKVAWPRDFLVKNF